MTGDGGAPHLPLPPKEIPGRSGCLHFPQLCARLNMNTTRFLTNIPPGKPPFSENKRRYAHTPKARIFVLTFRTFINTSFPSSFSVSNSPSTTLSCGYDPEYSKQWAADKTHFLSIKDPPQKGFLAPDHDLNPTCQGNSLMSACVPPTIRDPCFAIPQLRLSTPPVPDPPPLHPWPLPPP